jgi:hypothetical protein
MGFFRFRRSFGLIPGVRLNLGKKNASLSLGVRGLHYTVGTAGKRLTAGLPGTGLAYTSIVPPGPQNQHESTGVSGGMPESQRHAIAIADLEDKALENAKGQFSDTAIAIARMTCESRREGKVLELSDFARFGLTSDQLTRYLGEAGEIEDRLTELCQDHTPRKFQFVPVGSVEQKFLENAKGQFSDTAIAIAQMIWECQREGKDADVSDETRFGITPDQLMQYGDEAAELIRAANAQYRDTHQRSGLRILLVVGLLALLAWAAWQATGTAPAPSAPPTTTAVPQPTPLPKSGAIRAPTPPRPSDAIDPWSGIARPAPLPRPRTKLE